MTDAQENLTLAQEMMQISEELKVEPVEVKEEAQQEKQDESIDQEGQQEEAQEVIEDKQEPIESSEDDINDENFPLIPNDLSDGEKEIIQELIDSNEEAGLILIERYKNLKKGFYKKTEEIATQKKEFEGITEAYKPIEGILKQSKLSQVDFTKALINEYMQLNQNPAEKMKKWVKDYKLKPSDLGFEDYDDYEYNDVNERPLEADKEANPQASEEQIRTLMKIGQFAEATDAQGKLLRPHFEQVRATMGMLIDKEPNLDMQKAYDKACMIEGFDSKKADTQDNFEVDIDAIREKAKKAKKASKGLKTNSAKPDFSNMSIAEELQARMGN